MILTWKIWRGLHKPPLWHPLYRKYMLRRRRFVTIKTADGTAVARVSPSDSRPISAIGSLAVAIILMIFLCSGGWLIIVPLLCFAPIAIFAAGTLFGLISAIGTAGALAAEREEGRFDQVAATPLGQAGLSWIVCSVIFNASSTLGQIRDTVRRIFLILFVGIGFVFALVLVTLISSSLGAVFYSASFETSGLNTTLMATASMAALYFDFVQSIVIGCIIGMLIPTYAPARADSRLLTLGIFLMIKFLMYSALWLIAFELLPLMLGTLPPGILHSLRVATYYAANEMLVMFLWRHLADRLDGSLEELNQVLELAHGPSAAGSRS